VKLSKRRKVCVAILGLGLVALVVDRTVLGAEEGDGPAAGRGAPAPAARASMVGGDALDRGLAVLSVGERLEQFRRTREGAGISDAFAAVGGWFERAAAQKQAPVSVVQTGEFRLGSISGNLVRVNGTMLSIGYDTEVVVDKDKATERRAVVRLISVDKRSAVIETEGQLIELSLNGPENDRK
jgi:hypothetical protein